MDEEKQKKIESGKALFDVYLKKKHPEHGKPDFHNSLVENAHETTLMALDGSTHGTDRDAHKMDSISLQKKTAQFDTLNKKIKHLQDVLSEKKERIDALEIENRVLREGKGDGVGISPRDSDKEMIKELHKMVDARDTYIAQLSDSLQKRSEELECSLLKEKELNKEIQCLQQQSNNMSKETEIKISEAYSENVEYKAKVEIMSRQIQEYSELVQSLRSTLENNNKEHLAQKEEMAAKARKLEKYKSEVSEDIKNLMRQVETLNFDITRKESELFKSQKEVETLRSQLEEQFGVEIVALKTKLENKYAEDVKRIEMLYDGMLLEHIRKSDADSRTIEDCNQLAGEIKSCKKFYEKEINNYKEELQRILENKKTTEEKLTEEIEKYKKEADHYKQQVENFENKVAGEVQKIQCQCLKELDKYESERKEFANRYEEEKKYFNEELCKLSNQLKNYAISEAEKDVELETYKNEILKLQQQVASCDSMSSSNKSEYERENSILLNELNAYKKISLQLETKIEEYRRSESQLLNELSTSRAKLNDYENQVSEFNKKLQVESNHFSEKYQGVVHTFEEQIQNLMNELERNKTFYEKEITHYTSVINVQENQIKNLEAKLNFIATVKKTNGNLGNDSISELGQMDVSKHNIILSEKTRNSENEALAGVLKGLKEIKTFINKVLTLNENDSTEKADAHESETQDEYVDNSNLTKEVEKTIGDLISITRAIDTKKLLMGNQSSSIITSTPNLNHHHKLSPDNLHDFDHDLKRKCEILKAENTNLTKKLEVLTVNMKEMEYCLFVSSNESKLLDKKYKVLDCKITELEKLKLSECELKTENRDLKERLAYMEENEMSIRKQLGLVVENNLKLEQMLNRSLIDLKNHISSEGYNNEFLEILNDLKTKSEEIISLKSQLSYLQKSENESQRKVLEIREQCEKFIAKHELMVSELNTKQKELDDIWEDRNRLSAENKLLQSKLLSVQEKSSMQVVKSPSTVESNSTFGGGLEGFLTDESEHQLNLPGTNLMSHHDMMSISDNTDEIQLKRLQTMQFLTASIGLSSKTNLKENKSSYSLSDQIDLELQLLDENFDDQIFYQMPTIKEEDENMLEEDHRFLAEMSQGDALPQVDIK